MSFSRETRRTNLGRFKNEKFDVLIVGGGITGAGVARDAACRGLKVALVEREDFASGTSSKSSKLIHGGLRYLENLEFGLVFEALSERANLLKTAPHMVRPLKFYFPVYKGDAHGRFLLFLGMWLYDVLALFRTPGFHKTLSRKRLRALIPFLKSEGLKGGFQYYDASMWDDVMVVEVLRAANERGAAIANYVEAREPLWCDGRIAGFRVRDLMGAGDDIELHADRVIVCAGPWTDEVGARLSTDWKDWLAPSKGVHLIFDLKRIPIDGALVMSHPKDGRISFVIPRPDYGAGVVIVGTTDGPTPENPKDAAIEPADVEYLMDLLDRYFPDLRLERADILSAYVGVRPLFGEDGTSAQSLQKVSREHYIGSGPGGTTLVAGGKYTTYRKIAEEVVQYSLTHHPAKAPLTPADTHVAVNPRATPEAIRAMREQAAREGLAVPEELIERYGADAVEVLRDQTPEESRERWPDGFPALGAQLRRAIREEMTLHLSDFYLRRLPLYASRADHAMPWADTLSRIWAREHSLSEEDRQAELKRLETAVSALSRWRKS